MKYQVVLRGENFEINYENKIANLGFFTTRFVKADTPEGAELKAVEIIKNDQWLKSVMVANSQHKPAIYLEEIQKAKWWKPLGGKGYTFWAMHDE